MSDAQTRVDDAVAASENPRDKRVKILVAIAFVVLAMVLAAYGTYLITRASAARNAAVAQTKGTAAQSQDLARSVQEACDTGRLVVTNALCQKATQVVATPIAPPGPPAGPAGQQGDVGGRGPAGLPGRDGTGVAGIPGAPGSPGTTGVPGAPGSIGMPGTPGGQGSPGMAGVGTTGAPGSPGTTGSPGTPGSPGSPGTPGAPGANGSPAQTLTFTMANGTVVMCQRSGGSDTNPTYTCR